MDLSTGFPEPLPGVGRTDFTSPARERDGPRSNHRKRERGRALEVDIPNEAADEQDESHILDDTA
jgi:hypothetical protein